MMASETEHAPAADGAAGGAAGGQHQAGTEAAGAFPPFDSATYPSTVLWLVITFGLLYLAMARYALPRVGSILKSRSRHIHDDLAAANRMRDEAREAANAYEKTLNEARARAQQLAAETRNAVKNEQDGKRRQLDAELNAKLAAAETSIAETKAAAMANVGQIAADAAGAIVQHFTGAPADADAIAKALLAARA